ncbi:hypothetical protein GCM10023310_70740 [Paenibacillus vulneris]|uniref:Uncharacterized protein n=1 Tax=Paenibacillus vulneris TaxID=1133364 RepID=A0ABW3UEZ4_9BACL
MEQSTKNKINVHIQMAALDVINKDIQNLSGEAFESIVSKVYEKLTSYDDSEIIKSAFTSEIFKVFVKTKIKSFNEFFEL